MSQDLVIRWIASLVFDGLPVLLLLAVPTVGIAGMLGRRMPGTPASLVWSTAFGLFITWLVTAAHLLGLVGLLNGWTSFALLVLPALGLLTGLPWLRQQRMPRFATAGSLLWLLPLAALLTALVAATVPPGLLWGGEPNAYDVLSYHLQIPREWHDLGAIAPLHHNVFSRMPLGNEVLFLVAMHLKGGAGVATLACHFVNVALAVGTVAATFAAVRGGGGSSRSAQVAALLVACVPWTLMLATIAYNEPLYLLAASLTAAWLVRLLAAGEQRALYWIGLFIGLGLTAKYPAVLMLLVPSAIAVGALRRSWKEPLLVMGISIAVAGPWFVRNLLWFGNPISPLVFGVDGWEATRVARFADAHDAPLSTAPTALWHDVLANGRFGYGLWPLGIIGLIILFTHRPSRRVATCLCVIVVLPMVVWLLLTHQIGRFLVPMIPVLAIAAGLAAERLKQIIRVATLAAAYGVVHTLFLHNPALPGVGRGLIGILSDGRSVLVGQSGHPTYQSPFDEDPRRPVYLVGDAKAFNYDVSQLHYKVVFDVPPAQDAWRAWLGQALDHAPDEALVVVDPGEVARLARTYGTPPLDPAAPTRVMTMGQVRQLLGITAEASNE